MNSLTTIFISYSHKDLNYLEELLKAVKPTLSNVTTLKAWADEEIASGDHWESEILRALNTARAGVLLISNDFLNSTYIREKELPVLIPREQGGTLRLFIAYASAVAEPALRIPWVPGDPGRIYDLSAIQAENAPDRPLEAMTGPERNALFVALAEKLHKFAGDMTPTPATGSAGTHRWSLPGMKGNRPGTARPECLVRLHRHGSALERDFLLPGHQRWLSPELSAPDALDQLELWQPGQAFDGDLLFELLFGDDPVRYREILGDPYGEAGPETAEPSRYPWRIRLLIDDRDHGLQCLPWARISHQGISLTESGWTVELSPAAVPGMRPELPNHAFIMPGRILLVFPDADGDLQAAAHLRDVQGLLQQLWDRPAPIFVATDAARLGACLREYAPRLVYFYGRAAREGRAWRLSIPDGTAGSGLGFDALKGMFSSVPPSVIFLNLLGEDTAEALPQTAVLVEPPACKLVTFQTTPRAAADSAQRSAMAWLAGVLSDDKRLDPVWALHVNGHAFGACRAAYQQWDPHSISS